MENNGIYKALPKAVQEIRALGISSSGNLPIGGKTLPYRTIGDALAVIPDYLLKHEISMECNHRNVQHYETNTVDKYGTVRTVHTWVATVDYKLYHEDGSYMSYSFVGQGEGFTKGVLTAQTTALRNFLLTVCGIPSGDLDEIQTAEKDYFNNNNSSKVPTNSPASKSSWKIYYDFKKDCEALNTNSEKINTWKSKYEQEWKNIAEKIPASVDALEKLLNKISVGDQRIHQYNDVQYA